MEVDLLFKEERPEIVSEWEKEVPMLSKDNVVTAYLMNEIYEPNVYNELCYTLEHTKADTVKLVMNNGGGQMDTMLSIINSIKKSNAKVVAVISGCVASAATMIALSCDEIEVAEHTSWLTHYYSGGSAGKGNEIRAKNAFDEVEIPKMFHDIHRGFFTEEEIERVMDGKDEWLNKEQILKRFANMKAVK